MSDKRMKLQCTLIRPLLASVLLLQGCATVVGQRPGRYPPTPPTPPPAPEQVADGTIYRLENVFGLFSDNKARQVGDTIIVRLSESTQASKSATTDFDKQSSFDTGTPTLLGKSVTRNGQPILTNSWDTEHTFEGEGSSQQSNSLTGNITVTVAEVFPNGNLRIQGEKWLTLNQGSEYIQIAGIVRPADIEVNNTVDSFKLADARITYGGNGAIADANRPGLLSKLLTRLWPL
ncbi:MAG: flagellar basal body L-ring protein FlgH [Gammaproteobacteria bacterium]